jgi:putative oxidoreductase
VWRRPGRTLCGFSGPAITDSGLLIMLKKIMFTNAPASVILIRLLVGAVFLTEGIQKFLYPAELGAGRFAKIGLPSPEVLGPLVGGFEVVCGALVILGLFTRLAAIPLLTIISVAIWTTKVPLLKGGFWKMAHEARTDYAMLLGSLFLLIVGAGLWSLDARQRTTKAKAPEA